MANLYHNNNYPSSSSQPEPDEISLFLQQILLRSSSSASSSSSSIPPTFTRHQSFSDPNLLGIYEPGKNIPDPGQIPVRDPSSGLNSSIVGCLPEIGVANVSSSSVGTLDNDPNEYDCESEEAAEALMEEAPPPNQSMSKNSAKRSRAAEVHNLSEKRRRSRINEKMKALQNLIPNSNKTDKASMLDEAIEYLKQLQLQVQMLTMRNGLSLYPICLPGVLQPNQIPQLSMDIPPGHKSSSTNSAKEISNNQGLSNCINPAPVSEISRMIGSRTSFGIESAIPDHLGHFVASGSSNPGIFQDVELHRQQMDGDSSQAVFMGKSYCPGLKATASVNSDTRTTNQKETCIVGGETSSGACQLPNMIINDPNFSPQFDKYLLQAGWISVNDAVKKERSGI